MRDDNNKPLNGIDGTALHNIESKRLIPARSALLRLEATQSKTNMMTLMGERIAAAADKHLNSMMAFVALQNQSYARRSEEHTSELQSLMRISYAVFCLKKKTKKQTYTQTTQSNIKVTI